jgi:fructose transport system ATP-binding protein
VSPKTHTMNQVVGLLTGALRIGEDGSVEEVGSAVRTGLDP